MKQKLRTALLATILSTGSAAVFAQGIPTIDTSAIAYQIEQLAQLKEQIENQMQQIQNQVAQIEEAKNQVLAMTGSREMGNLLKDSINNAIPDDWKMLYENTGIDFKSIFDKEKFDIDADLKNLAAIDKITKDSLINSQKIMEEINSLTNEINNTEDIKATVDLQARINTQQLALQQQQINLDQAYRVYEINEKIMQQKRREHNNCLMRAWGNKTDPSVCG